MYSDERITQALQDIEALKQTIVSTLNLICTLSPSESTKQLAAQHFALMQILVEKGLIGVEDLNRYETMVLEKLK